MFYEFQIPKNLFAYSTLLIFFKKKEDAWMLKADLLDLLIIEN
jgi:hypothetical protein